MEEILQRLKSEYPASKCSLLFKNPFQLLVATMLSAQCTDERVNQVTALLFRSYPKPENFDEMPREKLAQLIFSTGFYNNKSKSIKAMVRRLIDEYDGQVPNNLEALVKLPGVGRKTANVVLGNAFGIPGLTVDTHVTRISNLLGFVKTKDAIKIEFALVKIVPKSEWTLLGHLFIDHGRKICIARRPNCTECILNDLCPSSKVD